MIKVAIVKIVNKEDLTYDEAYAVMNEIMSSETTATQNAAFLAALSTKSARAEMVSGQRQIPGGNRGIRLRSLFEEGFHRRCLYDRRGKAAGRFRRSSDLFHTEPGTAKGLYRPLRPAGTVRPCGSP